MLAILCNPDLDMIQLYIYLYRLLNSIEDQTPRKTYPYFQETFFDACYSTTFVFCQTKERYTVAQLIVKPRVPILRHQIRHNGLQLSRKVTKTLLVANQEASADLVNVVSSFVMLNETRLVPNSTKEQVNMFKNFKKTKTRKDLK